MSPAGPGYKHTQTGTVLLVCLLVPVVVIAVCSFLMPGGHWILPLSVLFLALAACFRSLTVEVDAGAVNVIFGGGYIKRNIPLDMITSCSRVRNTLWMGYGIHFIGRGWLYNVSGRDAVEVELSTGRRVRIGTDDPDGLIEAIDERLPRAAPE